MPGSVSSGMIRSGWPKTRTILARVLPIAAAARRLERLLPTLVGLTVFAFACGSSSVAVALRVGHPLRWVLLVALLVAAGLTVDLRAVPRRALLPAFALVGLAVLSTAWSVAPRTTFEHAVSLGLLFAACLLLAARARGDAEEARRLCWGIVGAAAAVAIAGLIELGVAYHSAVEAASYETPARYRGFGQDPNTAALLFGVVAPLALWSFLAGRRRWTSLAILALLVGSIVASGSRGGLGSAAVGCLLLALVARRGRAAAIAAAAVVVIAAVGAGIQSLPKPAATSPATVVTQPSGPKPGFVDANLSYPLDSDVGRPLPGGGEPPVRRGFFSSSGRGQAWSGAAHAAARRPIAGHGFGTEQIVFVDRYYSFVGGLPENSYLGLALQLGAAGLLALVALVVVLVLAGVRTLSLPFAGAGLAVLAAGLVAAIVQSYLYSAGNIAALALWLPAFLLAGVAADA